MKELITLVQPAFDWTWKNSVQVALLIGLVLLVQKVLGRWLTPRLRYALSLLILFRLLLPAVPPSPLSIENLFTPSAGIAVREAVSSGVAEPAGPITSIAAEPVPVASTPARPAAAPFALAASSRPPTLSVVEVLGLVWACGLLALVSLAGWRYAQWCRLIRQGQRLTDTRLLALLDGARQAMGVRRPVTLVAMAQLSSPAVFGFWRVRLLLPEDALGQLTDQDLRLLFLHEMAHVRRQDMLLNLLLMAVQFVHWFNPLVWVGLHRLRADRELVCDAMVLQRTRPEERSGYGSLLLKLLTDFPAAQQVIPTAVPVVSSKSEIKRRIILIKHHRSASLAACVATALSALALACLTFTGSSQPAPSGQPLPPPAPVAADLGVTQSTNLVINIDAQGKLSLGQTPVTMDQLRAFLTVESAKYPQPRLDIRADKHAPVKAVVGVMDACEQIKPEMHSRRLISIRETQQNTARPETINVTMIPAPDFQMKYQPPTNASPDAAPGKTLSPEQQRIIDAFEQARQDLAVLETQTHADKPLLYIAEQYREVPRSWFETSRGAEVVLLQTNAEAVKGLRPFVKLLATKEVMEDARFRPLIEASLGALPAEVGWQIGTDADKVTGYTRNGIPDVVPADKAARVEYVLREINARVPGVLRVLETEKQKYKVDDAFIEALKVKLAVSSLMGFVDLYIGFNMPPELDEARRKVKQLDIQLSQRN